MWAEPNGIDATDLAGRVGLHPNTVRWHLGILGDAGLVTSEAARRQVPGRPRIVFHAAVGADADAAHDEYRLVANVLAEVVSQTPRPADACEDVGRSWGRRLAAGSEAAGEADEERALAEIAGLLDQQGFEPRLAGHDLEMHRCPFFDLAETHPEVVCSVHLGLLRGALSELGAPLTVSTLHILPRPGVCIARLAPTP